MVEFHLSTSKKVHTFSVQGTREYESKTHFGLISAILTKCPKVFHIQHFIWLIFKLFIFPRYLNPLKSLLLRYPGALSWFWVIKLEKCFSQILTCPFSKRKAHFFDIMTFISKIVSTIYPSHTYSASVEENMHTLCFHCLYITVALQHFFACCCETPQWNVKLFETSSSHARCGWVLGIFCRFSKIYFFCLFEASGIRFTHQIRVLTQYWCHMDDLWMRLGGGTISRVVEWTKFFVAPS